jgi:hypothetical protein
MKRCTSTGFSRDYRDIGYFVKHVRNIDLRLSLLQELGYRIGLNVLKKGDTEMTITIGKRGERRIQVTGQLSKTPVAKCVILENVNLH